MGGTEGRRRAGRADRPVRIMTGPADVGNRFPQAARRRTAARSTRYLTTFCARMAAPADTAPQIGGSVKRGVADGRMGGNARVSAARLLALACALVALLLSAPGQAQLEAQGFARFMHNRWSIDDGAPGIFSILPDPRGWLWIAGIEGLWRFDGVTFEHIPGPAGTVMEHANAVSLMLSKAGELWVGYAQGAGAAVYRNGRLQPVPMVHPPPLVDDLFQTSDDSIWFLSYRKSGNDHLYRLA